MRIFRNNNIHNSNVDNSLKKDITVFRETVKRIKFEKKKKQINDNNILV